MNDAGEPGALRRLADRIVGAVKDSGSGMEDAEPAIKAFNEVAQPMARGYELLTGGSSDKKQEGWLRRIHASLTGFRKEEGVFAKIAGKRLKAIEEKPVAQAGGDNTGMLGGLLGGLLGKIPGIGTLAAGAGGMLGRAGGALAGAGRSLLGRGALRRIPIIGALFGGIGAASDVYDSESDSTLSRREKDQRGGKAIGGFAGSMGGMLAGAKLGAMVGAFAGPVGAAIGGAVGGAAGLFFGDQAGQIVGTTVGGWVSDLRDADIPGKISAAWMATVEAVSSAWDTAVSGFSSASDKVEKVWGEFVASARAGWDSITGLFAQAYEGLKKLPVIGAVAATAVDKAVDLGGKAVEGAKAGAAYVAENTTVGRGVAKAWDGAKAAGNWVLGQTSQSFESGKGGAGTVSSGKGDFGGASYGTYQLSSSQGTLQKFLGGTKYGREFEGLKPGTPEFDAKWKAVAQTDSGFADAQHQFIKDTHYDPAMAGLKDAGLDLSKRGAAVQDALWSTSVQFGAGSAKRGTGAVGMFRKALAGRDVEKMSDQEVVTAIQDYKIENNDKLFANSSGDVRAGTAKRAKAEKTRLIALAGEPNAIASGAPVQAGQPATSVAAASTLPSPPAAPATPVVATVSAPAAPAAPALPAVAEAQPVAVPLATSGSARKSVTVVSPPAEVGQDIRERGIAHIATGGLSA
ncbi:MAG: hypothetical protein JNM98_18705 [Rhodocyclaceae bacterium]|nr:hypothetical protein [Rhodocyclaceae bacterium]